MSEPAVLITDGDRPLRWCLGGRSGSLDAFAVPVVDTTGAGDAFTAANVRSIRPGHGLHPRHLADLLTRRAACAISRGTPLQWEHLQ
jgi:sugar/nucleoside kinase (ribokinase family)